MNYKIYVLLNDLREKGFLSAFKRLILYLLRIPSDWFGKNRFVLAIRCGAIPNLKRHLSFYRADSGLIKLPKSELVQKVRAFWYSNIPGNFTLNGEVITRKDIFLHGGPNPSFTCLICQKSEWLSRIKQKNLFIPHSCPTAKKCQILCTRQGDELWTHFHQNFDFSIGCDPNLPAPKGLINLPKGKDFLNSPYHHFFLPNCDQWMLVFRRRLAHVCQIDVVDHPININWSNYDFLFIPNNGRNRKFASPTLPVILYCHDFWDRSVNYQWVINWVRPDILLTPYPTQWKQYFQLPKKTKIVFYPFFESVFFTRSNLNDKKIDLLVVGGVNSSIYALRLLLNRQISQFANRYKYKIEFFPTSGAKGGAWEKEVYWEDSKSGITIRFLNKWSEYLGSAKYVVFGRMKYPILIGKYYEILGSGAIPIFPEVPDLKLLGVKPFKHYIPLSEIEGNNERLTYFLDHYEEFRYIAKNANNWYKSISDKMLFDDFENLIREITGYRYPKRLV